MLEVERTFWEKATILHAEHHRHGTTVTPDRLSRHYYDLYQLAANAVDEKALEDLGLLRRVVEHKKVFFRSAWARYDETLAGRLHLLPTEEQRAALRRDYDKMNAMFFGGRPTFDRILADLITLESKINSVISTADVIISG
ncbi:MAG: nucleotidyl transferase AbiEii/AbiGii toxin family protein [Pyrinomonadaceae bacterium MAG19_C2-C3]|nr:nucleotidyl transferase AbiEii/AbiGii toxin family protein [Pyrinomonadaceae bacterium MAG19_C2-C3]